MDVRRTLGRTGLALSPIGFGAFKIGRNQGIKYDAPYDLPDDDAVAELIDGLLALGVNYFDTAPAYGLSEDRLGVALCGSNAVISTKTGETFEDGRSTYDFSAAATESSVQRSLRRLRRDALDLVFVHAGGDEIALQRQGVVEALEGLRERGLVRAIGFSGRTVAAAEAALSWADAIMVEYHLDDRSHEPVMAAAADAGVGVIVKKALASGRLDPAESIRFVLSNPAVTSVVVGSLDLDHLAANVRTAEAALSNVETSKRRNVETGMHPRADGSGADGRSG